MTWYPGLEEAFNPKAIAVVGVSAKGQDAPGISRVSGSSFIDGLREFGFPGRIYPVHPSAPEIAGLKAYPSLASVPEHLDYVIVAASAPNAPKVLEECVAAGVRNVHVFTAGFGESGEEEGKRLEQEVAAIARRGKLNLVGPNCMGICYIPASRFSIFGELGRESGPIAFVSQSGGLANQFIMYAYSRGLRFSKGISYGNAAAMDGADFLEYLATDSETKIICLYIEGVNDGQKLVSLVREINRTKPVIVWKGGSTEFGRKAVASHTGSLAGNQAVWDAFFKQTGAIRVYSLEEMCDVATAVQRLPPVKGLGAALVSGGGGFSVMVTDHFAREGLEVPTLSPASIEKLSQYSLPGSSVKNPLDIFVIQRNPDLLEPALELIAADPSIDILLFNVVVFSLLKSPPEHMQRIGEILIRFAGNHADKPLVALVQDWAGDPESKVRDAAFTAQLTTGGIAAFHSSEQAARALAKVARYYQFLRMQG